MPHFIDYPEDHYQEPEPCPAWCIIPREPGEAPDEHVHTAARRGVACVELWRQRRYAAGYGYGGSRVRSGSSGDSWVNSNGAGAGGDGECRITNTGAGGSDSSTRSGNSARDSQNPNGTKGNSSTSSTSIGGIASDSASNEDIDHNSSRPSSSRPVIVQHHPEAVTLDIVRYRFNGETEDWIYIGDGIRGLDLSPESARRLVRALGEYVGE